MPAKKKTKPTAADSADSLRDTKMLFLVGHGLQSPLSAIRWGCGRLKRGADNLTGEQAALLDGIQRETRLLADMFDSLLLLAKVQEGAHTPAVKDIFVRDFLLSCVARESLAGKVVMRVICPEALKVRADRTLLDTCVHSLLLALSVSAEAGTADIVAGSDRKHLVLTVNAPLKLTLLEQAGQEKSIVGGVAGFLLAVVSALAPALHGSLESARTGETVTGLTLRLPLQAE